MVTLELAVVHVRTVHDDVLASRRALASSIRTRGSTKYLRDLTGSISARNGFPPLFNLVLIGSTASNAQFRELIPSASDRAQLLHSMRVTGADKAVYVVSSIDRGIVFVVQVADSGDTNQAQTPHTTAFDLGWSMGDASGFFSYVMYNKYARFAMPWSPTRSDNWRAAWPEAVDDAEFGYAKNEAAVALAFQVRDGLLQLVNRRGLPMPRTKYIRPVVVYFCNLRGNIGTDAMSKQLGMFAYVFNIRALDPEDKLSLRLICLRIYQANALYGVQRLHCFLQRLPQVKPDVTAAKLRTASVHAAAERFRQRHSFRKFLDLLIRERGVVPLHAAPRTGDQPTRNARGYEQLAP
jgi:hypothetical protein